MVKQGDYVRVHAYDKVRERYPVEVGKVTSIAWWLPFPVKVEWQDGTYDFFEADEVEVVS